MICVSRSLSFYVLYVYTYIYILHVCVCLCILYTYIYIYDIHICTYICAGYRVNPFLEGFRTTVGKHRGWNLQQPPGSLLTSPFGEYRIGWNPPASYIGLPWWCMHTHVYIYLVLWCYTLCVYIIWYPMSYVYICAKNQLQLHLCWNNILARCLHHIFPSRLGTDGLSLLCSWVQFPVSVLPFLGTKSQPAKLGLQVPLLLLEIPCLLAKTIVLTMVFHLNFQSSEKKKDMGLSENSVYSQWNSHFS